LRLPTATLQGFEVSSRGSIVSGDVPNGIHMMEYPWWHIRITGICLHHGCFSWHYESEI